MSININKVPYRILMDLFLELEYDHLDYTRPITTWKPHYQRMTNRLGSPELSKATKSETDDVQTV